MAAGDIFLSQEGFEKLQKDLEYMKGPKRREIAAALEEARLHGDLSENAEYDAAKEAQAHNEKRIAELQDKLSRVRLLDYEDVVEGEVRIGATVTLIDLKTKAEEVYMLVAAEEADYAEGKISIDSPIGKGLLGLKEGEEAIIKVPAGELKYKVVKITR